MKKKYRIRLALDYLISREALDKLKTDCLTIGDNAPLILPKSYGKQSPKLATKP